MAMPKEIEALIYLFSLLCSPFLFYCCLKIGKNKISLLYKEEYLVAEKENDEQKKKEIFFKLLTPLIVLAAILAVVILEILNIIPLPNCIISLYLLIVSLAYFPEIDRFLSGKKNQKQS